MAGYQKSKGVLVVSAVVLVVFLASLATAQDKFPSTAITVVVHTSAGGGTDVMNRFLGAQMEKIFEKKVMISNMPAGTGGVAAEYVWQQKHDGHTLLGCSEGTTFWSVIGATKHGAHDWIYFIAAGSPGVMAVKTESPYKDIDSLLKAAKERPKTIRISNAGMGKTWHIRAAILEKEAGVQFNHIPYAGSNPAILAILAGEVDVVSAALPELYQHVRAGKLRIITGTENERIKVAGLEKLPSLTEKYPDAEKYYPMRQFLGFAVPKDVPPDRVNILGTTFEKVINSAAADEFFKEQYMTKIGLWGEKGSKFAQTMESNVSWVSKELGVAKVDPGTIGIPKPVWAK
ncbi:MAG: tripartite tricarboxylate transporter substrate binding protein [Deltaproteobacteria bacterium]|nr:tripartite tricarboxylate transporter substrate binding protein [Deltaproteobacteria bacterium]